MNKYIQLFFNLGRGITNGSRTVNWLCKWKLTKLFLEKAASVESYKNCVYRRLCQTRGTVVFAPGCYIGREGKTVSREGCVNSSIDYTDIILTIILFLLFNLIQGKT